jgi:hypothetical protein
MVSLGMFYAEETRNIYEIANYSHNLITIIGYGCHTWRNRGELLSIDE